jgi:5-methylthioadenosine/S-adenosylhomocysteine deaminase
MWEEIRLAALIHKGFARDATVVPAYAAVHMATRGGAEALGMADRIGAITVGRRADLIQVRLTEPRMLPRYDIYSHIAYAAAADDVDTVVVDGQILMHERQVLTLDGAAIAAEVAQVAEEIRAAVPGAEASGGAATPTPSPITGSRTMCPSCDQWVGAHGLPELGRGRTAV